MKETLDNRIERIERMILLLEDINADKDRIGQLRSYYLKLLEMKYK